MIQRNVPGIGPYVLLAFAFGAVPAVLAGFALAMLASAMPRAGGSYVYASRGLSPYLGFVASFSQWFALSVAIGVVVLRARAVSARHRRGRRLDGAWPRRLDTVACGSRCRWRCCGRGRRQPARRRALRTADGAADVPDVSPRRRGDRRGVLVRPRGLRRRGVPREGRIVPPARRRAVRCARRFLSAAAVLFASFIGFDSIAQAGGERDDPSATCRSRIGARGRLRGRVLPALHGGGVSRRAVAIHRRGGAVRATSPRRGCSAICCRRSGPSSSCPRRRWRSSRICRRCCWASRA